MPSKILTKIVIKRISDAVDTGMRKEQAGLRKEQGCTVQIFTVHNIIEQCTEWQRQLYLSILTLRKPSTASRESLWHILKAYVIPLCIVQIIKSFTITSPAVWEAAA